MHMMQQDKAFREKETAFACTAFGNWKQAARAIGRVQSTVRVPITKCIACMQSRQKLATLADESLFTTHALLGIRTS